MTIATFNQTTKGSTTMSTLKSPKITATKILGTDRLDPQTLGEQIGIEFQAKCGRGDSIELYFPTHYKGAPEAMVIDKTFTLDELERIVPALNALLADPRVQEAITVAKMKK